MRYAGVGPRLFAQLIDVIVVLVVLGVPIALISGQTSSGNGNVSFHLHGTAAWVWLVVTFGYWIVLERLWGTTLGKRALNVKVVGRDGASITWAQSVGRNLLRIADAFPYLIPYLAGAIAIWSNGERRRIGDLIAGTFVVYRD